MFLSKIKFVLAAIVAAGVLVAGIGNGSSLVQADPNKPVKPGADPVKPVKPGADPVKPVGNPVKPVKPGADPVKPGEKPAKPVKPDGVKSPGLSGTLKSVNAAKGTLVVSTPAKGGGTNDETFATDADTKVYLDGKEVKLGELKVGLPVGVKLTQDRAKAIGVSVEGPTLSGEVKEVDAAKHTLLVKVTTWPDKTDKTKTVTEDKTFKVADDAQVSVPGQKKATLADLQAGTNVSVRISADGERVIAVSTIVKMGPVLSGELKEVAADKKTVKVAVTVLAIKGDKSSAKTEEKSIKLADDVKVVVDGNKLATLADLKIGGFVSIQMALDGEKAVAISSKTKGGGDPGVKKPGTPDPVKPVKPGATDPAKPVKPGATDPVKPVKPGTDPAKPVKPGAADPVKPVKP